MQKLLGSTGIVPVAGAVKADDDDRGHYPVGLKRNLTVFSFTFSILDSPTDFFLFPSNTKVRVFCFVLLFL